MTHSEEEGDMAYAARTSPLTGENAMEEERNEQETRKQFDPTNKMRTLRGQGGGSYLDVKFRIEWFRSTYPHGTIRSYPVVVDPHFDNGTLPNGAQAPYGYSFFRAEVTDGKGGEAWGHGTETASDFGDYVEKSECCSVTTTCLTRRGFVAYDELLVGEEVAAYDLETDALVWTPLQAVSFYPDAPVVRLAGKWFEAIVTPNHSWATAGTYRSWVSGESPRRLRETVALKKSDRIILAAVAPDGDSDLTPDEAAILGWLFTDGTVWNGNGKLVAAITQSKPDQVARIRELVGAGVNERVGLPTTRTFPNGRTYECRPQHTFALGAKRARPLLQRAQVSSPEDLPGLIPKLTHPARAAMLEAMMDADGDTRGYFGKQRKPGVFEAWRILCTLEGHAVGPVRNEAIFPVRRMEERRYISCSGLTVTDAGFADVWCPTTMFGTWVARMPSGQITITGNTKAIGRALASLGFGTAGAMEMTKPGDDEPHIVDGGVKRGDFGQAPQGGPRPMQARNPNEGASEPQMRLIGRLRGEVNLGSDGAFDAFLQKIGIEYRAGQTLSKGMAGQIINGLNDHKAGK